MAEATREDIVREIEQTTHRITQARAEYEGAIAYRARMEATLDLMDKEPVTPLDAERRKNFGIFEVGDLVRVPRNGMFKEWERVRIREVKYSPMQLEAAHPPYFYVFEADKHRSAWHSQCERA